MLIIVNIFLLVLVLDREARSARYEESARAEATLILAQSGITLDRAILPKNMALTTMLVTRNAETEAHQAAALVGTPARLSADTATYTGPKGSVRFYPDGEFFATLAEGAYPLDGETPGRAALDALRLVGFDGAVKKTEQDGARVTVRLEWSGTPVFVSAVTPGRETVVTIANGALRTMAGYRLTGVPVAEQGEAPLGVVTILLRLLAHIKERGDICSRITEVTEGYTLNIAQGGQSRLIPTWHIVTDTKAYYLNAITGNVF